METFGQIIDLFLTGLGVATATALFLCFVAAIARIFSYVWFKTKQEVDGNGGGSNGKESGE